MHFLLPKLTLEYYIVTIRLINVALRLSSLISKLFMVLIMSRYLTSHEFGYYGLFASLIVYLVGYIGFEFHTYSNRNIITSDNTLNEILTNHTVFSLASIALSLPVVFCIFYFELLPFELAVPFFLVLLFEYLSLEVSRVLNILDRQIMSSFLLFFKTTFWIVPSSLLLIYEPNYRSVLFVLNSWFIGSVFALSIGAFVILRDVGFRLEPRSVNFDWIFLGLKKSFGMFSSAQAALLLLVVDRFLIKYHAGVELTSIYIFYFGLTNAILALFESSFFVFFIPKALALFGRGDFSSIDHEIKKMGCLIFIVCVLSGITLCFTIDYLIDFTGKVEYINYKPVFYFLLVSSLVKAVSLIYHFSIYSVKEDKYLIRANFISLINFALLFFLMEPFFHALYAASISMMCVSVFHLVYKYLSWTSILNKNIN